MDSIKTAVFVVVNLYFDGKLVLWQVLYLYAMVIFISVFQVLAHADLDRISEDSLWNITRGLEEFNNIVATISFTNSQENCLPRTNMHNLVPHHMIALRNGSLSKCTLASSAGFLTFDGLDSEAVINNSYRNIGDTIKPIPFIRVLNILAKERSKYTAVLTHRILTSNEDFLHVAHTIKKSEFSWTKDIRVSGAVKWQNDKSHVPLSSSINTSDYHSASGSSFSASLSSNSLPRAGKIVLPAITKDAMSLCEFTEREQEFAAKFLQIVCHSTNFVKRTVNGKHFKVTVETSPNKTPTKLKASLGLQFDNKTPSPYVSPNESPVPSTPIQDKSRHATRSPKPHRNRSQDEGDEDGQTVRKSVCFADSADYSVMVQLTQKYMDLLWQCFNGHLLEYLNDMSWGGVDAVRTQLGSLQLCDDAVAMVVVKVMQHLSTIGK